MLQEGTSVTQGSDRSDGAELRRRAQGRHHQTLQKSLESIDGVVAAWSDEFVFGQAWVAQELAWSEQMLVAISALAALGHHAQLRNYIHGALQGGIPEPKIREALRMLTVYAGFPVAIGALSVLATALSAEGRAALSK
jgi:4-carboxymuconolactone decarboxylase